jgi:hypothetical protein
MEKKFLKYTLILIIFFIGLSMGVTFQENSRTKELQDDLRDFEDDITNPNNDYDDDFTPTNPTDEDDQVNDDYDKDVKNNVFTSLAKDGEYLIKKGISLIFEKSDDLIRVIFK